MVDAHSQHKLFAPGFRYTSPRVPLPTYRHYYSEFAHRAFKQYSPPNHHCRVESFHVKENQPHWPAFLLTFGIKQICENKETLYHKEKKEDENGVKLPDPLLYNVGSHGSGPGQFNYPRGMSISEEGDIAIADTDNHRVQIFNSAGVLKICVGEKGKHRCQFDRPSAVAAMPNGNFAVADTNNNRVQILRPKGQVRFIFPTKGSPVALACDEQFNLFVGTQDRQIEVMGKGGKFLRTFPLKGSTESSKFSLATNHRDELLVCETSLRLIAAYTHDGRPLWQFQPTNCLDGLAVVPVGISINPMGDIVLGDAMNHTINVYHGSSGKLIRPLLGPVDDLGAVQTVGVSPEGHLVVTEFSANGDHIMRIFRYLDCICHRIKR